MRGAMDGLRHWAEDRAGEAHALWGGNEALRKEGEDERGRAEEMHKPRDKDEMHGDNQAEKMRKPRQEQAEEMRKLKKENKILRKENEK